jgi:hypothetical protein
MQGSRMSYQYDYRNGRVTLNWLTPAVGLVRVHDDERNVPGPYNCVVTVFAQDGIYELMGLCGTRPTKAEFKHFYSYLKSLGLRKTYRRAKKGAEMYEVA